MDLPIAIGILIANEEIKNEKLNQMVFLGELALDGTIRKVNGTLPMCIEAKKLGIKTIILPKENSKEAAIVKGIDVIRSKKFRRCSTIFKWRKTNKTSRIKC